MTSGKADLRYLVGAWGLTPDAIELHPVTTGLINQTHRVRTSAGIQYALQRVSPIFGREVQHDIALVTEYLSDKGMITPRLVPTRTGEWDLHLGEEDGTWRLLTWVEGICIQRIEQPAWATAAGSALGRFHRALSDFVQPFLHTRLGVHDTPKHLAGLTSALEQVAPHDTEYGPIHALGTDILAAAEATPTWTADPERVVHGDPKITNLIFGDAGEGRAWIDLDTVSRMPLPLELGDAFRSWCNPRGEDATSVAWDLTLFEAAVRGYATEAHETLLPSETAAIVPATYQIMVELAARFCRDAIEDRYFGWDQERFSSRREHNFVRAKAQLALSQDLRQKMAQSESIVERAFAPFVR